MPTASHYVCDLDSMDWSVAQDFEASFRWEYDDGRESLLARLDDDALARWKALATPAGTAPAAASDAIAPAEEPVPLLPVWFWLLLVAALLAFAEPLVANYHLAIQREKRG